MFNKQHRKREDIDNSSQEIQDLINCTMLCDICFPSELLIVLPRPNGRTEIKYWHCLLKKFSTGASWNWTEHQHCLEEKQVLKIQTNYFSVEGNEKKLAIRQHAHVLELIKLKLHKYQKIHADSFIETA